jgi:transposase InsO family protein
LKVPQRQPKRGRLWLADGSCVRLRQEHSNHVWAYDFVEDRTRERRKFRMLCVVDEFTREALAIRVARKLSSANGIDVLADLFLTHGTRAHIRSDQGPEFVAAAVKGWIEGVGGTTAYIEKASPWENGYVESFNGKLRDELLNGEVFDTRREAQVVIEEWRRHYNRVRPHSSLGYRPPEPGRAPMARWQISSGGGVAAMAHKNSARTTRWGLVNMHVLLVSWRRAGWA